MTLQDVLQYTVWQIGDDQALLVADLVAALLFTVVGLLAVRYGVRWPDRRLQRKSVGASADPVIQRVALYGLSALVLLMALQLLGIPLTLSAVADQASILTEPAPIVIFDDFGDSALIFDDYFWCHIETRVQLRITRSDVRHRIDDNFRSEGIEIAFPQRDVHVRGPRPIALSIATDEDAEHEPTLRQKDRPGSTDDA